MDGGQRHPDILSDGTVQARAVSQQRDAGARHQLLRGVTAADEILQPTPVGGSELQVNGPAGDIHAPQRADIPCRT